MKRTVILSILVVLGVGALLFIYRGGPFGTLIGQQAASAATSVETVAVRPANDVVRISAAGNISAPTQQPVVLQVDGIVTEVAVEPGDKVAAGDVLAVLDTSDLKRAVQQAALDLAARQAELEQLTAPPDEQEVAAAQAQLDAARENLIKVQAGPTAAELAAAEASLAAAQAYYADLVDGKTEDELTQLAANVAKAQVVLQQAQAEYDKIAYRGDVGMTVQAKNLQDATIDYQAAKAAYNAATAPASTADLQKALRDIETARSQLETLRSQPTAADLASARAQLANAQSALNKLVKGPTAAELSLARIKVEQARLALEQASERLTQAWVRAPISGTVMSVDIVAGQRVGAGTQVATIADVSQLELTVNVAEVDIDRVQVGQEAQIAIDAMAGHTFSGRVKRVAPAGETSQGVVNYPVSIALTASITDSHRLSSVRPGMTAVASIQDRQASSGWLVPSNALQQQGEQTVVLVMRNDQPVPVRVIPGAVRGEWTIVQSDELHAGDQVVGSVSSHLDDTGERRFVGPGGGGMMSMPPPPPP